MCMISVYAFVLFCFCVCSPTLGSGTMHMLNNWVVRKLECRLHLQSTAAPLFRSFFILNQSTFQESSEYVSSTLQLFTRSPLHLSHSSYHCLKQGFLPELKDTLPHSLRRDLARYVCMARRTVKYSMFLLPFSQSMLTCVHICGPR